MSIDLQLLTTDNAQLLVSAIERVYGNTYPIPEFYDAGYIARAIDAGLLSTVVARGQRGEIAGCMSTVLEMPGDVTADGSALMVAEEYRGQGITALIGERMVEVYQQLGLGGLHLYALALHDRVQNQSGAAGAVVTGVLPAWFSRQARVTGYDYPDARIGAVCLYMPLGALPARTVYLPAPYAQVLRGIYAELPAERDLQDCTETVQFPACTVLSLEDKPRNGQRRVLLERTGSDFDSVLAELLHDCDEAGREVIYLDIPLADPGCERAVQVARAQGMFFGALMVDRRGCDRLRMQRYDDILAAPDYMVLATPQARALLDFVQVDRG